VGEEVLRHQVLVAAGGGVDEERVAPVHRHHEELGITPLSRRRARIGASPLRSQKLAPRRARGARRRPGTFGPGAVVGGRQVHDEGDVAPEGFGPEGARPDLGRRGGGDQQGERPRAGRPRPAGEEAWAILPRPFQVGPDAPQDGVEGPRREAAGEGVLLGDVERAEQADAAAEVVDRAMAEGEASGRSRPVSRSIARKPSIAMRPRASTARRSSRSAHSRRGTRGTGRPPPGSACWRGCAARDRRDVTVAQREAVGTADRLWLAREAVPVQGGEQEVAGAVAGEDSAGPVPAVGGGGEAHQRAAGLGVAEAGTGRPQYSSSRNRFTFVRATSRHQRRRRGQRSHRTISRPTRARLSGMGPNRSRAGPRRRASEDQPSVPVALSVASPSGPRPRSSRRGWPSGPP